MVELLAVAVLACATIKVSEREASSGVELATLLAEGPDFQRSARAVDGYGVVQGGWPLVVDYQLAEEGYLEVNLNAEGSPVEQVRFPETGYAPAGERRVEVGHLAQSIGPGIAAGRFEIRASNSGSRQPIEFQLFGIGAGEKAVGSMVIVDVQFGPPKISLKRKEKARFSFRLKKDFNLAKAAVYRPGRVDVPSLRIWDQLLECVPSAGQVCQGFWPGVSYSGEPSVGAHQLEIKAWAGAVQGAHWNEEVALDLVDVER